MRRLALGVIRNGSVASIAETAINAAIGLFTFRLIIDYASLATFGVWALMQSLASMVRLADVGVSGSVARYVGQLGPDERKTRAWHYVDTAVLFNAGFFTLVALAAYYPLRFLLHLNLPAPADAATAIAILPVVLSNLALSSLSGVPALGLIGLRHATVKSAISITAALVLLGSTTVLLPRYQLLGLALAQTCQLGFTFLAGWIALGRVINGRFGFRVRLRFTRSIIRETIGFSLVSQGNSVLAQLYDVTLRLALTRFGGPASTGLYELVDRVITLARVILFSPTGLAVPAFARAFRKGRLRAVAVLYKRQLRLTVVTAAIIYIGIAVASPLASWFLLKRLEPRFFLFLSVSWMVTLINALSIPAILLGPASGILRGNLIGNTVLLVGAVIATNLFGWLFGGIGVLIAGGAMVIVASLLTARLNTQRFGMAIIPPRLLTRAMFRPSTIRSLLAPVIR